MKVILLKKKATGKPQPAALQTTKMSYETLLPIMQKALKGKHLFKSFFSKTYQPPHHISYIYQLY